MKEKAIRHNSGKPQLSYILDARYAIEGAAEVMSFGANKYERNNWKKGMAATELIDSLLRHITAYMSGEDNDVESNLHHLDHALCNAIFLAYHHNGRKKHDNIHESFDCNPSYLQSTFE